MYWNFAGYGCNMSLQTWFYECCRIRLHNLLRLSLYVILQDKAVICHCKHTCVVFNRIRLCSHCKHTCVVFNRIRLCSHCKHDCVVFNRIRLQSLQAWFCGILQDKAADRKKKLQDQSERLQFDDNAKELVSNMGWLLHWLGKLSLSWTLILLIKGCLLNVSSSTIVKMFPNYKMLVKLLSKCLNSFDPGETLSYSASEFIPSCLYLGPWPRLAGHKILWCILLLHFFHLNLVYAFQIQCPYTLFQALCSCCSLLDSKHLMLWVYGKWSSSVTRLTCGGINHL